MKTKYEKSQIFRDAWKHVKYYKLSLSKGLKHAWSIAKGVELENHDSISTTNNQPVSINSPIATTEAGVSKQIANNTKKFLGGELLISEEGDLLVDYSDLNLGQRREINQQENNIYSYVGKTQYRTKFNDFIEESLTYPHGFWTRPQVDVLNYISNVHSTQGVSEKLLINSLKKLTEISEDIEIITDISIPIFNRNYGYKPDICIVYKKLNVYIDIEIDEPYDIISRKPIHYIGCQSDIIRNSYFTENGWLVFRFSESQVIKYSQLCCNYIANQLDFMLKSNIFNSLYDGVEKLPQCNRWTYNEALQLAQLNQREKDLGISSTVTPKNQPRKIFKGKKIDTDILPPYLQDRYNDLKKIHSKSKFVKIVFTNDEAVILQNINSDKILYLTGDNVITGNRISIDLRRILDMESLSSPFTTDNIIDYENIEKALTETIKKWGYAQITYTNNKLETSTRNIGMIFPAWIEDMTQDAIFLHAYKYFPLSEYITAECSMKNDQRVFRIDKINTLSVFAVDNSYLIKQYKITYNNRAFDFLIAHNFEIAEKILKILIDNYSDDLLVQGNYAHYLMLSGKQEEACEIYNRYRGKVIYEDITWDQMIIDDLNEFKQNNHNKYLIDNCLMRFGL